MKTIQFTVYSAKELKDKNPKSYEKAFRKFQDSQYRWGLRYGREMFESLEALIKLGGYELKRYSLGGSDCQGNYVELDHQDCDEISGRRACAWIENNILTKLRDEKGELNPTKLTGYCFDYDLIEALQKFIKEGCTIREAFESLASTYAKEADQEWEDQTSEERFLSDAEANDWQFFEDGRLV
jgi:hypothetical protein